MEELPLMRECKGKLCQGQERPLSEFTILRGRYPRTQCKKCFALERREKAAETRVVVPEGMKWCSGYKREKHLELKTAFNISGRYNKDGSDQLISRCKECLARLKADGYRENSDHAKEMARLRYYSILESNADLDPYAKGGTKICRDCERENPAEAWRPVTDFYPVKGYMGGLDVYCKFHARSRSSAHKSGENGIGFNISATEYYKLWEEQKGLCWVCGEPERNGRDLSIDHDHETGQHRKLLCFMCNSSHGKMDEDPVKIQKLLEYSFLCKEMKADFLKNKNK